MSLVALDGTPLVPVGMAHRQQIPILAALGSHTIDALNESCMMIGRVMIAGGSSKTIDTTGSSSIGIRLNATTFANAGTTVKVGIGTVDAATGPPVRATNVADVITMSVSKTMVGGGGGLTQNAWNNLVPDAGTMTMANGDLIAVSAQATARAGADSILVGSVLALSVPARPSTTIFTGAYADSTRMPNVVITFSDGTLGWIVGSYVASVGSTAVTWNNTSTPKEYGNFLQFPFPTRAYGILAGAAVSGDLDLVLYTDPLGTPAAQKTVSVDVNQVSAATTAIITELFPAPYDIAANTPYAVAYKPSSATNVSANYMTFDQAAHQVTWNNGANGYAISRDTGAFTAQNSNKDRFPIGLLVGAFDSGGGSGGGISRARAAGGF